VFDVIERGDAVVVVHHLCRCFSFVLCSTSIALFEGDYKVVWDRLHSILIPPFTGMFVPVTKPLSSLAKNAIARRCLPVGRCGQAASWR